MVRHRLIGILVSALLTIGGSALADLPKNATWSDIVGDGESVVFGRFVGKFESTEFRSRRIRLQNVDSNDVEFLSIDDGLGFIAETVKPGTYNVISIEAVYYPMVRPFRPDKFRPIQQRYGVKPKTGDAEAALLVVTPNQPVYIGTIEAESRLDGMVYRGQQLRVFDDFDEAYVRLGTFYPSLSKSLDRSGVAPVRRFMLKPTTRDNPLEVVVGADDPIRQARTYIADGKYKQAVNWLETFLPTTDSERGEARLLIGEALLADRKYAEAIEELGEVLLRDPRETRALRLLARAHAYHGDVEDTRNLYEALSETVPGDTEAHLHLGYIYALEGNVERADSEFRAAFATDFDYLLHDVGPFAVAMRAAFDKEPGSYEPPRVVRFDVAPPKGMDSRRASETSAVAVLVDHQGKVVAAQVAPESTGSMPLMVLSLVRATYSPASLNGVPVPAVFTLGGSDLTPVQ